MLRLQDYWRDRSPGQKLTLLLTFAITLADVVGLSWLSYRPNFVPLYPKLDAQQAGAIVSAVESAGADYIIRGETIWVDAAQRDALRMTLAGQGLPAANGEGYEILDGMSGFGTTSQMFDAAYWRAKEGELARTVLALPNVKSARVHLAVPHARGFRREGQASASITVTTNGTQISRVQAKAMKFLVASGVPGMTGDQVTVIDSERGVVLSSDDPNADDRMSEMKRNVERILEAHVGSGNAVVELNLDVVRETETLTEQKYDPQSRALVSQESEELADQNTNNSSGPVTAASNLPEGKNEIDDESKSSRSETRQRSNFEVSKVTREVNRQPGAVRRLTVAVLINDASSVGSDGTVTFTPRASSELDAVRELVSSVVGFDEARGDVITVRSLPFSRVNESGYGDVLSDSTSHGVYKRPMYLSIFALLAVVFLGIMLWFVKAKKAFRNKMVSLDRSGVYEDGVEIASVPTGEQIDNALEISDIDFVSEVPARSDPVLRLKHLMKERGDDSLLLLSGWISKIGDGK
ncbi:flagellar basal-body MS-ring/collar protein FliF [Paracoccus aestuariivivens]|uniref:Flagellar M-ring protein n=1 Tax=Paracoccus aestuariivivens TaxID=1820333 RepID=A0A6L6JCU3_9RHOB|nr:flagellar basal-body MS-ring/collar protein FliF [Paracoccus aestuariivivens]MTH80023.1 flagellar M-ring protein FliF [Paracoccus aestuariivivens]